MNCVLRRGWSEAPVRQNRRAAAWRQQRRPVRRVESNQKRGASRVCPLDISQMKLRTNGTAASRCRDECGEEQALSEQLRYSVAGGAQGSAHWPFALAPRASVRKQIGGRGNPSSAAGPKREHRGKTRETAPS